MTETSLTTTETSNRDMVIAGIMLLSSMGMFWYLDGLFEVSAYFWYSLLYVMILSPFIGVVLHARPLSLKLSFLVVMATAVLLA